MHALLIIGIALCALLLLLAVIVCRTVRVDEPRRTVGSDVTGAPRQAVAVRPLPERVGHSALEFDLTAHPRPTRTPSGPSTRMQRLVSQGGASDGQRSSDRWRTVQTGSVQRSNGVRLMVSEAPQVEGPAPAAAVVADGSTLTLRDAADALTVSPAMLVAWESRYGFPVSDGAGPERRYNRDQVDALAARLQIDLSIAAAINKAKLTGT